MHTDLLTTEQGIGVLVPCNVMDYAPDVPGRSVVAAVNPETALARVGIETLSPVATQVKARLRPVLDRVAG